MNGFGQIASKKPTKAVTMAQKRTKQEEIERLKAQLAALEAWPQDESEDEPECKPAAQARPHIVMPPPLPMVSCGADSAKVVAPKLTGDAAEAPMPALKVAATPAEGALLPALKPTATPAEALLPATMPAPMVQPLRPVGPGIKTGAKGTKSRTGRPLPVDLGLQHFLNQVKPGVKVLPKPNNPMETVMVGAVIAQKFQYVPLQKTAPIEFGWELAEVYDVGKGDAEYPWKLCFVERSGGKQAKDKAARGQPADGEAAADGKAAKEVVVKLEHDVASKLEVSSATSADDDLADLAELSKLIAKQRALLAKRAASAQDPSASTIRAT
eukprot:jgi/Mesvir1/15251/Mv06472-RA.1